MLACRKLSVACAAAFLAVEWLGMAGACHLLLLSLLRLFTIYVYLRCWSGGRSISYTAQPCGSGGAPLPAARAAVPAATSTGPVLTSPEADFGCEQGGGSSCKPGHDCWRSAGIQMPSEELVKNLIKSRRSVFCKDMKPCRLDRATLATLLEAANWAPSHGRTDPWHFAVFDSAEGLDALAALSVEVVRRQDGAAAAHAAWQEFQPGKRWANAAALVAICMRRQPRRCHVAGATPRFNPEWEEVAAVACAVQNMHLMATALPGGVCGYWSSWYDSVRDSPELRQLLGLQEGDACLGFFVLGCSDRVGGYRASRGPVSVDWR